jgi:ferredoxin
VTARKPRGYRLLRWAIQLALLVLFIFLFARTRYRVAPNLTDIFFRFDPLVFPVVSIATRTLVAAGLLSLVVVVATLLFGRFFCGFVCPLGTTIDLADAAIRRQSPRATHWKWGKFLVLIFLLASAALGASFVGFFDPLAIFSRTLTLVAFPVVTWFGGLVAGVRPAVFTETLLALTTFLVILGLGLIVPRCWCRNLCPLGGLLGFGSRFSLFKFSVRKDCKACGLCEKVCPTGAISQTPNPKPQTLTSNSEIVTRHSSLVIDSAECIGCLACLHECPGRTIGFSVRPAPMPLDIGRREAILALGSAVVAAPLAKSLLHRKLQGRLLRPPGSIPEPDFLGACIHCGRCMKVCPTNGLQPAILESGFDGLWTPRLVPRIGGCEKNCNMCGRVCPTSAIRNLPLEEKTYARVGTAVIDRSRCIAWEQNRVCLICDEACQYNAIEALDETIQGTALLRPFVDERRCVGCGICESRCPIDGPSAIQVFSMAEERKKTGWYKTDAKAQLRSDSITPKEDLPSGFIPDGK